MSDPTRRKPISWVPSLYFVQGMQFFVVMLIAGLMFKNMGVPNDRIARWTGLLGDPHSTTMNHRTIRTRLIGIAATLVNRSGRRTLRLPSGWPWEQQFTNTLDALRALPAWSG